MQCVSMVIAIEYWSHIYPPAGGLWAALSTLRLCSGRRFQLAAFNLPLATCHLSLATCHLPLSTCHFQLVYTFLSIIYPAQSFSKSRLGEGEILARFGNAFSTKWSAVLWAFSTPPKSIMVLVHFEICSSVA